MVCKGEWVFAEKQVTDLVGATSFQNEKIVQRNNCSLEGGPKYLPASLMSFRIFWLRMLNLDLLFAMSEIMHAGANLYSKGYDRAGF